MTHKGAPESWKKLMGSRLEFYPNFLWNYNDDIWINTALFYDLTRDSIANNFDIDFNIAWCIANFICRVARQLESHCTSQILNE